MIPLDDLVPIIYGSHQERLKNAMISNASLHFEVINGLPIYVPQFDFRVSQDIEWQERMALPVAA